MVRLHPIRILVVGTDDHYRAHVVSVVADLGPIAFAGVAIADDDEPDDVVALVRHERPEVLLLDATGCETAVRRIIVALAERARDIRVVVVCERSTEAARQLGALPKWGWTQDLRDAVEQDAAPGRRRMPRPAGPLAGWSEEGPGRQDG